ncbi:hypothetical protein BU14_0072s0001 [Porphyra umbilicalis]|uniref:Uncharacterized protein n=1 Tax=Porphyra umbilicalis TaxID=2786 RepID=A0A1X6PG45_PORUM|nr:hypothetical protein BU14_0072s0001 [Porphyra umbilicalis]|eukprot:OSX79643.1 hypothetical protein BU14_0072s0001 [Porphyra umbilicalis]
MGDLSLVGVRLVGGSPVEDVIATATVRPGQLGTSTDAVVQLDGLSAGGVGRTSASVVLRGQTVMVGGDMDDESDTDTSDAETVDEGRGGGAGPHRSRRARRPLLQARAPSPQVRLPPPRGRLLAWHAPSLPPSCLHGRRLQRMWMPTLRRWRGCRRS